MGTGLGEGRWSLLPELEPGTDGCSPNELEMLAETVAWQLLRRWGVVLWELWDREPFRIPWRYVHRALRRLEARGVVLGGRFVAGLTGEQFALPDAFDLLTGVRRRAHLGVEVTVAAADPLHLTAVLLPGPRVPAVRHRQVRYRHCTVVTTEAAGG